MANDKKGFDFDATVNALLELNRQDGALMLLAGCVRDFQALLPEATRLFQDGGEFPGVVSWGGSCIVDGWKAMAKFCEAHKEQFLKEAKS